MNVAMGGETFQDNTTGSYNTALGMLALHSNTTADNNTAVGYQAGYSNTTGTGNQSFGTQAAYALTTGNANTAMGWLALQSTTTSDDNSAFGAFALQNNTTGASNVGIGRQALYSNTTGIDNTAVGYQAGYSNTTNSYNTYLGDHAGYAATNWKNTFLGHASGEAVTTGGSNTILGRYDGNQNGLDLRTISNTVILSDGDGNIVFTGRGSATDHRGVEIDGAQFYPSADNVLKLGHPSYRWTTVYATTGTINTSDKNLKQDIADLDATEKLVAVRIKGLIKKYRFRDAVTQKGDAARIHIGAIAQEVQAAFVAEGLDPERYGMFCSDTVYLIDGLPKNAEGFYTSETEGAVESTQLGLRYEELLAFVISTL